MNTWKHKTIPIFVSHMGCPHDCAFCNQRTITGQQTPMTPELAEQIIVTSLQTLPEHSAAEIGFFGGSFTGIEERLQRSLLAVAKNDASHIALSAQLEDHSMYRVYHALVSGGFAEDTGTVDLPIGRHPRDRKKMAVIAGGREARTHYTVLARYGQVSYLSLRLETGRTHQIRVHMSAKGHPLLGDTVYGGGHTPFEKKHASLFAGQCLHAKELSFVHPRTGERMHFSSPLPPDFVRLLSILDAEQ